MKKQLINNKQLKDALKVKGIFGDVVAALAMHISGLNKMNDIYSHIKDYQGIEFAQKLLEYLNINFNYLEEELENIPAEEPFIIVSNHPFGAIDGMAMLAIIGKKRKDLRILTNFILSHIPNLEQHFFPVNPFTDKPGLRSSLKGLKMAKEHLLSGGVLGLFPAGEVSSNANKDKVIKDIDWQPSIVKLIKNSSLPVVPIYFDGKNSKFFHFIGKIHPLLRTVRLPRELANKRDSSFCMRIGRAISSSEIEEFTSDVELAKYLWNRTYALEANIDRELLDDSKDQLLEDQKTAYSVEIAQAVERDILKQEIENIKQDRLFQLGSYECYLSDISNIPNIMREIGRCREEAFRHEGEGTNKELDIDNYDTYYKHLFLWDKQSYEVVGAYRLGFGSDIYSKLGRGGFYTNSLFNYNESFSVYLKKSIELGRSFVSLKYQKEALPLMLLIKGLMYTVIKYPKVKYLIGPVSISAAYPLFYRSLMIYYLAHKQAMPELAHCTCPNHSFVSNFNRVNPSWLLSNKTESLEKFDRFIYRLSNNSYRLPTLLKKYLKINAKIVSFNVDPDFNYCVDGLIMLNLSEIPKSEIDSLSKEFDDKEMVYKRFDISNEER